MGQPGGPEQPQRALGFLRDASARHRPQRQGQGRVFHMKWSAAGARMSSKRRPQGAAEFHTADANPGLHRGPPRPPPAQRWLRVSNGSNSLQQLQQRPRPTQGPPTDPGNRKRWSRDHQRPVKPETRSTGSPGAREGEPQAVGRGSPRRCGGGGGTEPQ